MKIILYTTHCPKCKVLVAKLKQKNIEFDECDNVAEMQALGLTSMPVLKVDDNLLTFTEAVNWINRS